MNTLLVTIGLSLAVVLFFFVGVGIRILLVKDGEFKGSCSSNNPMLNKDGEDCPLCGRAPGEQCKGGEDKDTEALPSVAA